MAHPDRLIERPRNLEFEILIDRVVETDPTLLDELHDRRPDERLGDRRDPEKRRIGIGRRPRFHVGESVTRLEEDVAVEHDAHHDAGDLVIFLLYRKGCVEELLDGLGIERGP